MKCIQCLKEIEADGMFCKYCGAKIESSLIDPAVSPSTIPEENQPVDSNISLLEEVEIHSEPNEVKDKSSIIKNKFSTKKIVGGISLIIILLIAFIAFPKDPINQYLSLINKGDTQNSYKVYAQKIQGDSNKVSELRVKAEEIIKSIENDYLSGKASYDASIEKLQKYSEINEVQNMVISTKQKIVKYYDSTISFKKGEELEKANDLTGAIKAFSEVIEEDQNYISAQSKINTLKDAYIKNVIIEVEGLEAKKEYAKALNTLYDALTIVKNDATLLAKQGSINDKVAELKRIEEAQRLEKIKLVSGKIIESNGMVVTYQSAKLTTKILPDRTSGFYLYYTADNSEIYFDLVFSVKNTSSYARNFNDIFSNVKATYDNKFTYTNYIEFIATGDDIDPVYDWDSIDPLKTATYHLVVYLPREVVNSSAPISVSFNIFGKEQFLQFR